MISGNDRVFVLSNKLFNQLLWWWCCLDLPMYSLFSFVILTTSCCLYLSSLQNPPRRPSTNLGHRLSAAGHRSRHTANTPSSSKLTPTRHRHDAQTIHLVNLPPRISCRRTRPSINYDFTRGTWNIFYSCRSFVWIFESGLDLHLIFSSWYKLKVSDVTTASCFVLFGRQSSLVTAVVMRLVSSYILITSRHNTNTLFVILYTRISTHILEYTNTNSSSYSSNAFSIELLLVCLLQKLTITHHQMLHSNPPFSMDGPRSTPRILIMIRIKGEWCYGYDGVCFVLFGRQSSWQLSCVLYHHHTF